MFYLALMRTYCDDFIIIKDKRYDDNSYYIIQIRYFVFEFSN